VSESVIYSERLCVLQCVLQYVLHCVLQCMVQCVLKCVLQASERDRITFRETQCNILRKTDFSDSIICVT